MGRRAGPEQWRAGLGGARLQLEQRVDRGRAEHLGGAEQRLGGGRRTWMGRGSGSGTQSEIKDHVHL